MAYDEDLAARIREQLSDQDGVSEKRMFGGLAFLLAGNMAVGLSGGGELMVRVGPAHLTIWIEVALIGLFAVLWVLQTIELWKPGLRQPTAVRLAESS